MKIIGLWSGHDCSYSVLEDGVVTRHDELERFIREKEPHGDAFKLMKENYGDFKDTKYFVTCSPTSKLTQYEDSYSEMIETVKENNGDIYCVGHHKSHAANAFYSSNLKESLILTMDGGGVEEDNF